MGDHNEISRLVFDCSFHAALRSRDRRSRTTPVTPIYFMDTIMGLGFQPTEFVDVTRQSTRRSAMLEAHESQLTWLKDHNGVDIVEQMETVTPLPRPAMRRRRTRRASLPA